MRNAQFPFQNLPLLDDHPLPHGRGMEKSYRICRQKLWNLNGYLESCLELLPQGAMELFMLSEIRRSFVLEGTPFSHVRLFEAHASENMLEDETAFMILDACRMTQQTKRLSLQAFRPVFLRQDRRTRDLVRRKNESRIFSERTRLTLYSAPVGVSETVALSRDLDRHIRFPNHDDSLTHIFLCHLQFRAAAPFSVFNGHAARQHTLLALAEEGVHIPVLPLSAVLTKYRDRYSELVPESVFGKETTSWCVFMAEVLAEAAEIMLDDLHKLIQYSRILKDRIDKHAGRNLPAEMLTSILCVHPFVKPAHIIQASACHRQTAYAYLEALTGMGILTEKKSGREKLFFNRELSDIFSR